MRALLTALLLLFAAPILAAAAPGQDWKTKAAPFDAIRWTAEGGDDLPEVRVGGTWYAWKAIDEVAVPELVAHCKKQWSSRWQKRVGEDLVEALVQMKHAPGKTVRMELLELEGKRRRVVLKEVAMTLEKRTRARDFNNSDRSAPAVRRASRKHAAAVPPELAYLARPLSFVGWRSAERLTRARAEEDLDQLEWSVEHTHSYRDLRGTDWRAAFDALRAGLPDSIPVDAFAIQLMKLTATLGDGHCGVRRGDSMLPGGCLPFLLADAEGGTVAFLPDRSALLDPEHPYVLAIDGLPLDEWVRAAGSIVPVGSKEHDRFRALRNLRRFDWVRLEAGLPVGGVVRVEVGDASGKSTRVLELPPAVRKPTYGAWPRKATGSIAGDLGYLRVPSMDSDADFVHGLVEAMESFRDTEGLIIDVRGNGGGSRDALRILLPYFLESGSAPRVVNVAAYRLKPGEKKGAAEGYMSNRMLFPESSSRWSQEERAAIQAMAAEFKPDWTPPATDFSAWHYFVLSPATEEQGYHYEAPVVVLADTGCFSATDIFLGGLQGVPGVTLMGTPSGGGSGRSQTLSLSNSRLRLRLSSMASFRADGDRYDGKGIAPDVRVEAAPGDYLADGGDSVLEAAVDWIRAN